MLDAVSLDQLRTFIAAAETGSFSAAGRHLGRAQSVVSQTISNLEIQLGLQLFSREARYPKLTQEGHALLSAARSVITKLDQMKAQARGLAAGLEPSLTVVINVMFPPDVLSAAVAAFHRQFPDTPLAIDIESMGAVLEPVLERHFDFGVRGPLGATHTELRSEYLLAVDYQMMAAAHHPLAQYPGPIPAQELKQHMQLVLSDRSRMTEGRNFRVFAERTWRVSDLGLKHALIRQGVGWGGLPLHLVRDDIEKGLLVALNVEEHDLVPQMAMSAFYRADRPPGPAARWLIEQLKQHSNALDS